MSRVHLNLNVIYATMPQASEAHPVTITDGDIERRLDPGNPYTAHAPGISKADLIGSEAIRKSSDRKIAIATCYVEFLQVGLNNDSQFPPP